MYTHVYTCITKKPYNMHATQRTYVTPYRPRGYLAQTGRSATPRIRRGHGERCIVLVGV